MVKNIIAAGGDIELKTVNGEKPIDIAKRYHHQQLEEYLQWIGKSNLMKNTRASIVFLLFSDTKYFDEINQQCQRFSCWSSEEFE